MRKENIETYQAYIREGLSKYPDDTLNPIWVLEMLEDIKTTGEIINPEWLKAPYRIVFSGDLKAPPSPWIHWVKE